MHTSNFSLKVYLSTFSCETVQINVCKWSVAALLSINWAKHAIASHFHNKTDGEHES